MSSQYQQPPTPRVISPSPTPSEQSGRDGYFPPTTRAQATKERMGSVEPIEEHHNEAEDPELARARARSRSPLLERRPTDRPTTRQMNGNATTTSSKMENGLMRRKQKPEEMNKPIGQTNGFLSPDSAYPRGFGRAYWRNLSRSPSPFGLIPIHTDWKRFIHKHEVPRKALHVSIGFVTLLFYYCGVQPSHIHPILLWNLIPIFLVDLIRFQWPAFNRLYIRVLGAFMRESEAHDRFNGVIGYLAGLWIALRFCRKDVGIVSVLLLSWCDTAASTFGRLWGRYTPRVRRGKSLAGSLACCAVGVLTAGLFWGVLAPRTHGTFDEGRNSFAFQGTLTLPSLIRDRFHLSTQQASITGGTAVAVLSVVSGLVASVSEAIDLWGLDDNLTIPMFCGIGLGVFLWACGGSLS